LYLHGMGNRCLTRISGGARALCLRRASSLTYQLEPEGGRAGRRLVVRGGDLLCEAETCRVDPSCRELVRDAANWPKTGRFASQGLDQGPHSSSS
jgi:hypothetical protein